MRGRCSPNNGGNSPEYKGGSLTPRQRFPPEQPRRLLPAEPALLLRTCRPPPAQGQPAMLLLLCGSLLRSPGNGAWTDPGGSLKALLRHHPCGLLDCRCRAGRLTARSVSATRQGYQVKQGRPVKSAFQIVKCIYLCSFQRKHIPSITRHRRAAYPFLMFRLSWEACRFDLLCRAL